MFPFAIERGGLNADCGLKQVFCGYGQDRPSVVNQTMPRKSHGEEFRAFRQEVRGRHSDYRRPRDSRGGNTTVDSQDELDSLTDSCNIF